MVFLAWILCYSVRVDMSVAIVAMVITGEEQGLSKLFRICIEICILFQRVNQGTHHNQAHNV